MFPRPRLPRLDRGDLKRFGRVFLADLQSLMPGRLCRLEPVDAEIEPDPSVLVLPLRERGRTLALLVVSSERGRRPSPELKAMLPRMLRQGLRNMRLRKALDIDQETALFSPAHLERSLSRALNRRGRQGPTKNLSLDEPSDSELALVRVELRGEAEPALALPLLAERLAGRLALRFTSRVGRLELAFFTEGQPQEIGEALASALAEQAAAEPASRPAAGWALYPQDLTPEERTEEDGWARRQSQALAERAATALFYGRQNREVAAVTAYGDLLRDYGRVAQILPLDRAVVNLGRLAGAKVGQVFLAAAEGQASYKAELTLFEIAESYSLGHLSSRSPAARLLAGDRLIFSRQAADDELRDHVGQPASPNSLLAALPDWDSCLAQLEAQDHSRPMAVALARLDGYDKTLSLIGREECERLLNFIFERVMALLPAEAICGHRGHSLLLAWPGGQPEQIKPAAHRLLAELKEPGPVSLGLVFSPGDWSSAAQLASDAQKALTEATFSGQGHLAVFGPLSLNISGDRLFEDGDLSGALAEYERGLALAPGHGNLLNSLGVCHGRLGQVAEALAAFEKALDSDPDNMMAHYNIGYTHFLAGRPQEAEERLQKAAELAPDNFEALFLLGKIALQLGRLDRALPALKRAAELEGSRPAVHRLLGEALMLAHDYQGALAAFKKAVKYAPNDAYALSALGILFMDLANDLEVARSLCLKSVEIEPSNSLYRQRLGRILFQLEDWEGAERELTLALDSGSQAPELRFQLGCLAERAGRFEEAQSQFQAALERDPAYRPALDKLQPK